MRDPGIEIIFGRIGRAVANIGGVRGECPYLAIGIAIGAADLRPARNAPVEVDLEAAQADLDDRRRRLETRRKTGRASCRERVCLYVVISVVAVALKKQN